MSKLRRRVFVALVVLLLYFAVITLALNIFVIANWRLK